MKQRLSDEDELQRVELAVALTKYPMKGDINARHSGATATTNPVI